MDILGIVLDVTTILVVIIGGLFLKNYLPSYFDKKGENLATKEDVQEITRLTESVQGEFKREFEDYSKDRSFKYHYYYDQFRELYTKLYCIIAQSEYLRRFFKLYNGSEWDFEEVPFIELHSQRNTQSIKFGEGKTAVSNETTQITDGITEFNKRTIFDMIIEKGEFASQRLLKLAIAYRFVHKNYAGTDETSDVVKTANDEEFVLIKEIIHCIVNEYNFLRKELKLDYVESELTTGLFENISVGGETDGNTNP